MSKFPLGNRDLIRRINRSVVLNTIKTYGPISRTDVARRTGLSAATITGISAELLSESLIFEKEAGNSRGGRRPILLAINPRGGYVVGIKLTEQQAVGAITDLETTVIGKYSLPLISHSLEDALRSLVSVVEALIPIAGIKKEQLFGVGVGLAGIIDAQNGVLRHSPIFGWRNVSLVQHLCKALQVPVYIDNDVNTLTLTEQLFGSGQGVDNFLTVTVGRGVGLGIVVNGQLYRGANGGAGEFGHTVIESNGPACACGKRGCIETYVSDPALLRMAGELVERKELLWEINTLDDLYEAALAGEPAAIDVFSKAGSKLGQGIANLINLFSPEEIIISGEGVRSGDLLFDPMRAAITEHVISGLAEDTEIRIDVWEDDAWARGAAGLVLQELFKSPIHRSAPECIE